MAVVFLLLLSTVSMERMCASSFGNSLTWNFLQQIDSYVANLSMSKLEYELKKICMSLTECDEFALRDYDYTWGACHRSGCTCDFKCHLDSTCCPHMPYSYLNVDCVPIIYDRTTKKTVRYALLVTECLTETHELASKCADDRLFIPVTSQTSGITYRNKLCAMCHNDTELLHWSGVVSCEHKATSWFEGLKTGDCKVSFPWSHKQNVKSCATNDRPPPISACNVTGLWRTFDTDINWACKHLNQKFLQFKNIFCYICNPSLVSVSNLVVNPLAECAQGQIASPYSNNTRSLCDNYNTSHRMYPYKNIYCKHCNEDMSNQTFRVMRDDFNPSNTSVIIEFTVKAGSDTNDAILNAQILLDSLNKRFQRLNPSRSPHNIDAVTRQRVSSSVTTELQKGLISICGEDSICLPYSGERNSSVINSERSWPPDLGIALSFCTSCSCGENCYLTTDFGQSCCIDKLVTLQPYGCLDESLLPILAEGKGHENPKTNIRVIDKCMNLEFTDISIIDKCEAAATDDMTLVPVEHLSTGVKYVYFKNIYCMLCNTNVSDFKIYVNITCGNYIEYDILESVDMFFTVAEQHECRVQFALPLSELSVCDSFERYSKSPFYDVKCFEKGTWFEPIFRYQNNIVDTRCPEGDDNCDVTSMTSLNAYWLFNTECEMCNEHIVTKALGVMTNEPGVSAQPTFCSMVPDDLGTAGFDGCRYCERDFNNRESYVNYRTMFAVSGDMLQDMLYSGPNKQTCNTWLDPVSGKCVNLRCYGNRVIIDGACVYADDSVTNMYYKIASIYAFNETACSEAVSNGKSTLAFLQSICYKLLVTYGKSLRDHSDRKLLQCDAFVINESSIDHAAIEHYAERESFTNTDAVCYESCFSGAVVYTVLWFYIASTEQRTIAEDSILEISQMNITTQHLTYEPVPYFVIPEHMRIFCTHKTLVRDDYTLYEQGVINKHVLFCVGLDIDVESVVLNKSDVILTLSYNSEDINISVPISSVALPITNGSLDELNSVFLCEETYRLATEHFKTKKHSTSGHLTAKTSALEYAYRLFSSICTILSLIALFLTMITYSLFPVLRTVPGRNNLTLAVCLFVTQVFFEIQALFTIPPLSAQCIVIGLLIHFFWLGTFCAMCICCYHMFRMFISLTNAMESDAILTRKYIFWVLFVPTIVISLVLTANSIASSGRLLGYGSPRCFLDNLYSIGFGFVAPSFVLFLLNIIFFGATFYKISGAPKLQKNKEDRRDLVIYVKLCTITGVTWPMLFIDSFFDISAFSFVATFFNALQGFFIFLSFVCNERVFGLYKRLCSRSRWQKRTESSYVSGKTNRTMTTNSCADTAAMRDKEDKVD